MSESKQTAAATGGSNTKQDIAASVGAFLGTKAEGFADARFLQFVTIQTTVATLMYMAEQEAFIPKLAYEGKAIKMEADGTQLSRKLLADAGREDRNQHKEDGRTVAFTVLRNWLCKQLNVDDQVATQTLEFCSRLLDYGYGLREWNGKLSMDASGKLIAEGLDEEHPLSDKRNDDHKPWEVPGLFRIKPQHVFTLNGKPVPEVDVCDLIKQRDANTGQDMMMPYPWEKQELTLQDRSYVFAYEGRDKMFKRPYEQKRCGKSTFMAATRQLTAAAAAKAKAEHEAAEKAKAGAAAATGATPANATGAAAGATPATGAGSTATAGAATAAAGAAGAGVGAATGANRAGGNESRDDANKLAQTRVMIVDDCIAKLPPAALDGQPGLIQAVMRLHLHLTLLLNGMGLVEYTANPNDDTRKAAANAISMSGGKKVTPAHVKPATAKAAPAKATGKAK